MTTNSRTQRRHDEGSVKSRLSHPADRRSAGERDRDRILYAPEFQRLSGITQVGSVDYKFVVHNRLTHVLEVAQIGRRLAQSLNQKQPELANFVDPDVVEAACLAHDLGHPPFGHIAEQELDRCCTKCKGEGFEGNAQTFRVLTKLAAHKEPYHGLNLSRATLRAVLKYPWLREPGKTHWHKWNAYRTEQEDFAWVMDGEVGRRSIEAELMDLADDIAYCIHDVLDFYKAGKVPLAELVRDKREQERFLACVRDTWSEEARPELKQFDEYAGSFRNILMMAAGRIGGRYSGSKREESDVNIWRSFLITQYVNSTSIEASTDGYRLNFKEESRRQVGILKQLTWQYVIRDPALASQQYGQREIIRHLFNIYHEACGSKTRWHLLPVRYRELAESLEVHEAGREPHRARLACDIIAGMSEQQAVSLFLRFKGIDPGISMANII